MTFAENEPVSALLTCPATRQPLHLESGELVSHDRTHRYRLTASGIPLLADAGLSEEGRVQQRHYDRIDAYLTNLQEPHTQEHMDYLDRSFRAIVPAHLGTMLEVCCGAGEAFTLFHDRIGRGIGIDVSSVMLEAARRNHPGEERLFVQGDATRIPLADESVDAVMFLGGIHHVNDRSNRRFCWTASDGCYWPSTEAATAEKSRNRSTSVFSATRVVTWDAADTLT